MYNIFLVRHWESLWNTMMLKQWISDFPLTITWIQQSLKLGKYLKDKEIDLIVSSDLQRSIETTKYISEYHPNSQLITTDSLRERDYWPYNWMSFTEINKIKNSSEDMNIRLYKQKGVESTNSIATRARKVANIINLYDNKNTLIVSHSGFMKVFHQCIIGEKVNEYNFNSYANGSISLYSSEGEDENWKCIQLNSSIALVEEEGSWF